MTELTPGQTYTLTGDEPPYSKYAIGTLKERHAGVHTFPLDAVFEDVDGDGDYVFRAEGNRVLYVSGDWEWPDQELDMVNHPAHYNSHPAGIEAIDVIETNPFYNLAAAMKYLWRVSWGSKHNDIEDLQKAVWYIQREIGRRNGQV